MHRTLAVNQAASGEQSLFYFTPNEFSGICRFLHLATFQTCAINSVATSQTRESRIKFIVFEILNSVRPRNLSSKGSRVTRGQGLSIGQRTESILYIMCF